jgi:uncharacterized RDD family membrane protein YckC
VRNVAIRSAAPDDGPVPRRAGAYLAILGGAALAVSGLVAASRGGVLRRIGWTRVSLRPGGDAPVVASVVVERDAPVSPDVARPAPPPAPGVDGSSGPRDGGAVETIDRRAPSSIDPWDGAGAAVAIEPEPASVPGPGHPLAAELRHPSWWRRLEAVLADDLLVIAVGLAAFGVASLVGEQRAALLAGASAAIVMRLLYAPAMLAVRDGQTLGKALAGVRVIRSDGSRLGLGRAFLRESVVKIVFTIFIPLGWIDPEWSVWDRRRPALHDVAAGTRVVEAPRRA